MNSSKRTALFILLATVIVASGCVHADSGTDETPPDQPMEPDQTEDNETNEETEQASEPEPKVVTIKNDGISFEPDLVEVQEGQEVTFVFNKTSGTHSLRIPELSAGTGTLTYEESENFTATFEEEGEYDFICSISDHAEQGMNGTIVVS